MKKSRNSKNEKEKIDILFEDSLKEYKVAPSKQVWEGIERNFPEKLFGGLSSFKTRLFYMSIIIISLALTSAIVYFVYENNSQSKETSLEFIENKKESKKIEITEETEISIKNDEEIISLENSVSVEAQNPIINNIEEQSTDANIEEKVSLNNSVSIEDQNKIEKNAANSNEEEIVTYDGNILQNPDKYSLTHSNLTKNNYERTNRNYELTRLIPLKYKLIDFNSSNNRIFSDYRNEYSMVSPVEKQICRRKPMDISFGINITPSIIYYKSAPKQNAMAFDFVAEYEINKFSIQMGIGGSYSADNGEYNINYQSYDSVGYYLSVVSFTFDPINPDSIIFNTKSVDIFDTVQHCEISRLQNNYSYLQFPLLVYHKLFNFKGISCSVKAGTMFSILIGKNEPEVDYSNKEAFLIDINRQTQTRLKTNWRIVAGLRFKYQLSGKIDIVCEPTYMQFINSIYENKKNTVSKNPHIIGLRAGLLFKL